MFKPFQYCFFSPATSRSSTGCKSVKCCSAAFKSDFKTLFTCSLRCTDQVTSTQSNSKLSLCNRNSTLNWALYSDISWTSCTHTTSARKKRKKKNFTLTVRSIEAHPLAERKEVVFPTKHCSRAKMAPRNTAASGGFTTQHGLMSYRWLLCAMTRPSLSTFKRHHVTGAQDWMYGWSNVANSFQGKVAKACLRRPCNSPNGVMIICIFNDSLWSFAYSMIHQDHFRVQWFIKIICIFNNWSRSFAYSMSHRDNLHMQSFVEFVYIFNDSSWSFTYSVIHSSYSMTDKI